MGLGSEEQEHGLVNWAKEISQSYRKTLEEVGLKTKNLGPFSLNLDQRNGDGLQSSVSINKIHVGRSDEEKDRDFDRVDDVVSCVRETPDPNEKFAIDSNENPKVIDEKTDTMHNKQNQPCQSEEQGEVVKESLRHEEGSSMSIAMEEEGRSHGGNKRRSAGTKKKGRKKKNLLPLWFRKKKTNEKQERKKKKQKFGKKRTTSNNLMVNQELEGESQLQ
ncbi:hypothetical protein RIF29_22069 [Crotalaria pallida]|uniref:Uncharacterized protein n=1 Tax=Crotalaria pallida TaxID=3830 RepID=A0AAN9F5Y5_CROPI